MLKRIKRQLLIMISLFVAITSSQISSVLASDVAHLSLSVVGDGYVTISDSENEYKVEEDETFNADVQIGTNLKIDMKANSGTLKEVLFNGQKASGVEEDTKSVSYSYTVQSSGAIIKVSFSEKEVVNIVTPDGSSKPKVETEEVQNNEESSSVKEEETPTITLKEESYLEKEGITIDFEKDLTDLEKKMIKDYQDNKTDEKGYKEARKAKAEETGLIKYCDSDYFLKDSFYEKFSYSMLNYDGLGILNKYAVGTEIESENKELKDYYGSLNSISTLAGTVSVTNVQYLTFTEQYGYYINNGLWTLSNGKLAFCAQARNVEPNVGDTGPTPTIINNTNLAKVLYYGYGGPGDILTSRYGSGAAAVLTDDLASYAYSGESLGTMTWNGYHWRTTISGLWNEITAKSVPSSFKVYGTQISGAGYNHWGQYVGKQILVYANLEPEGTLQIQKTSSNTEITNGNNYYSLEGAKYGVYSDSGATKQVATLTIGSNGYSEEVTLDEGTYYVKEISAPKGYALDTTIYSIKVNSGRKSVGTYSDKPKTDPVSVLLQKVDSDSGKPVATGDGSLANAQYTFKFYKGEYADGVDPSTLGKTPDKTWVIKTDSKGICYLNDTYKVSGDSFYYNSMGVPTLPLGTLVIKETLAPTGYKIDTNTYVRRITPGSGNTEGVNSYNEPTSKEQVLKVVIEKKQSNSDTLVPGTKFTHTKPDGSTETLTTDSNGKIEIVGPQTGIHRIKETSVTDGLEVNKNEFVFEVKANGVISVMTGNLSNLGFAYKSQSNGDGLLTVYDDVSDYNIKLVKVNDKDKLLDGAEFTLYSDKACTKVVDTKVAKNGELTFENLKDRTYYYFKETEAPDGYRIPVDANGNVHVYEVYVESTPSKNIFNFYVDGTKYTVNSTTGDIHLEGTKADRVVSIKVVNKIGMKLPNTGSNMMLPLIGSGVALMLGALVYSRKRRR